MNLFCVASTAHSHCSSANKPNLVLYGSGGAGIQRRLIGVGLLWSELGRRQSLITAQVNRGQSVLTAGMIGMIFGTRSRYAVFPIHRINLRSARTNSRSLRLAHAPFPTFLDRGQSLNTFKDRPRPSRPCRYVAAHCRSIYDHCRSIHVYSRWLPIFRSG